MSLCRIVEGPHVWFAVVVSSANEEQPRWAQPMISSLPRCQIVGLRRVILPSNARGWSSRHILSSSETGENVNMGVVLA